MYYSMISFLPEVKIEALAEAGSHVLWAGEALALVKTTERLESLDNGVVHTCIEDEE